MNKVLLILMGVMSLMSVSAQDIQWVDVNPSLNTVLFPLPDLDQDKGIDFLQVHHTSSIDEEFSTVSLRLSSSKESQTLIFNPARIKWLGTGRRAESRLLFIPIDEDSKDVESFEFNPETLKFESVDLDTSWEKELHSSLGKWIKESENRARISDPSRID